MKILVLGLDCAAPEILLQQEDLPNFRRLMAYGSYGELESVVPPITVPAWMCMATSQDPGSLGIYGFRNRMDYSYDGLGIIDSSSIKGLAIWDQLAMEGGRSILIGVPPSYPTRKLNGIRVGCFLTPDPAQNEFTYPETVRGEIEALVGEYPVDVKGFRTEKKDWLLEQINEMTRKQFEVLRHLMRTQDWDYLQYVSIGLDRIQHGFWEYHDSQHVKYDPENRYPTVIRDYYRYLDGEIGKTLAELDEEVAVLILSDHGAQRLDGGFCVNEWLIKEGLLVLDEYPEEVTPFSTLHVNWDETLAWSTGGYYARVFLNVAGREPNGVIEPEDYEAVREDIKARFEATEDEAGALLGTKVFKPQEVYHQVNNIPPDLIVHFGDLYWRSIGGVGYGRLHVQENDTGPDGCNHAQYGAFILAAPNLPAQGPVAGAHLLDMAPTLLELGGYTIPSSMQGQSLAGDLRSSGGEVGLSEDDEEILRERLSGLGYIE